MAVDNKDTLDQLQNAVINEKLNKQNNSKKKTYHFDRLKMYFGDDYEVIPSVIVSMPKVGNILDLGESEFYHSLSPFLYNSTSIRLFLWENKIDWCNISDIEVFAMLLPTVNKDNLKILFKDIDFSDFSLQVLKEAKSDDEGKDNKPNFVLYSPSQNILISEDGYMTIAEYVREILNAHPKVEKAKGKTTKSWMIQEDRMNVANRKNDTLGDSTLLPLISTCINHPGFKYKLQELREMGIYQFMDSVQRLQIYESSRALLSGSYSGFCDTSKIPKEQFNFFRELHA